MSVLWLGLVPCAGTPPPPSALCLALAAFSSGCLAAGLLKLVRQSVGAQRLLLSHTHACVTRARSRSVSLSL